MAKIKAIFYIPLADNDGRILDDEIDELEDIIYSEFAAWTNMGVVTGTYRMPDGTRSNDTHLVYSLIMEESALTELEGVLAAFKAKTLQDAIYLEIQRNIEIRLI